MKKTILSTLGVALIFCVSLLTSCSKSNESLLNDYEKLGKEIVEATKSGDLVKVASLSEKGSKLEKEINSRELTPEEQERYVEIQAQILKDMNGAASDASDNAVDGLDQMKSLLD